jgi:serine/threonine protein kinase
LYVSLTLSPFALVPELTLPLLAVSYKWIKGDLIGRGTFGHVYIGFSVNTGETIAVKQVELPKSQHDKDDARTKGMVQSLKAEIELLKDLDHPNIVLYLGGLSSTANRETGRELTFDFGVQQGWSRLPSTFRFSSSTFPEAPLVASFVRTAR